ncbi:acyl-CoA dehydrogenase family protein [Micrococcoides hystricis]|uniref:Acyl-CoA dehydrogenase family protein n=1 Tax=Micrococcoides hystricis TaxID=1572761 RepID=A0ABV6PAN3_9MICC
MTSTLTTQTTAYWKPAAEGELEYWVPKAQAAAAELAQDVLARDAANQEPFAEVEILRKHDLITAIIPSEFGGGGAAFSTVFEIVRELAKVDGSIAQLFAYHSVNVAGIGVFGDEETTARLWRKIADEQALVGDAVNPTDPHLNLRQVGENLLLNGTKRFATGAGVGEYIFVLGVLADGPNTGIGQAALVGREQAGVKHHGDWNALGQRLSSSGSVTFEDVELGADALVGLDKGTAWQALIAPLIQLAFVNFYLGIAEGALEKGKTLINQRQNAWFLAKAERYNQDHIFQRLVGELHARTVAVAALTEKVNGILDATLATGRALTLEARSELEVQIAQAKVVSSDVATDVTNRVFEFTGSSSAKPETGLDLYWRNVRTHSLHDPVDYKKIEVGAHFLLGEYQPISLYT